MIASMGLICLFAVSAVTATDENKVDTLTRIIGGSAVEITNYPFMASLQSEGQHRCGATVLSSMWILTAAHCVFHSSVSSGQGKIPVDRLGVMVGSTTHIPHEHGIAKDIGSAQLRDVAALYPHENFTMSNMTNDIALIQVNTELRLYGSAVRPVKLPSRKNFAEDPMFEVDCIAIGWGVTSPLDGRSLRDNLDKTPLILPQQASKTLRHVHLPLMSMQNCKDRLPMAPVLSWFNLCTYKFGKDACLGDSGGPLMCTGEQWGVTSWGQGCALEDTPGLWTRVDSYLDWIRKTMTTPLVVRSLAAQHLPRYLLLLVTALVAA